MNTEERIRTHLEHQTAGLRSPDRLDEIMREGRRRKGQTRVATTLAVAAAVVAVVMVGSNLLPSGTDNMPVATDPDGTTQTTTNTTVTETTIDGQNDPLVPASQTEGVIVADETGITLIEAANGTQVAHLESDRFYSDISTAYADAEGGLVFQHAITPLPWPQGAIMRLRPGADRPEILVSPPDGGYLIPVGPAVTSGGTAAFVFLEQKPETIENSAIKSVDLVTGTVTEVAPAQAYSDVSAGGDLVVIINREDECATISVLALDGTSRTTPIPGCLPIGIGVAVAQDGASLAVLVNGTLQIVSTADGTVLSEQSIADSYMVTSGPGGWVVRTNQEVLLINDTGTSSLPPVEAGWLIPYGPGLELNPEASLGNGSGQLPCVPLTEPLADQQLPPAIADKRQAVFEAASSCDYDALAALATSDQTGISFGVVTDPATFWVASGRRLEEPLALIARMLNTTPAHEPQYNGDWAWPAVHQDAGNEASWAELEPILGEETVTYLRAVGDGYVGLRVGIGEDGKWQFAVAGD